MRRFFLLFGATVILAAATFLSAPSSAQSTCSNGDKAEVLWNGSWYPATVRRAKGSSCFIHYDGYGNNWDEWVGPDRIRLSSGNTAIAGQAPGTFHEGDPVQVLWGQKWWPAHVLRVKGTQLFIHYDEYQNNWDEWVGPSRYRLP